MKSPRNYAVLDGAFTIPEYTAEALERYVVDHIPTGSFLESVLTNDLKGAIGTADLENLYNLPAIVTWVVTHAPMTCQGNQELYDEWIKRPPCNS
jgi:hypothetical protein